MIEGTQTEFTITQTFVIRATTQAQAEEAVIKDDFSEVDVQEIKTETTVNFNNPHNENKKNKYSNITLSF